jgi:hypothetical protein
MSNCLISVIILNYNGARWLPRCLNSLAEQSAIGNMQIIVTDNASTDNSDKLAGEILRSIPADTQVVQNGSNLGYCEGNNRGALAASGKYLLFLNTDTWLERDCIKNLVGGAEKAKADSASPMVLDYDDGTFQGNGASGFDVFGYLTSRHVPLKSGNIFAAPGCALMVSRDVFQTLGGFDSEFFMYADEADLAWRLMLCGFHTITVPEARVHHRGAVAANPRGGEKVVEFRTNEMVRFFATRNSFLVILKNAQNVLLLLLIGQTLWVLSEMLIVLVVTRKWTSISNAYIRAFAEIWRLRGHVAQERNRLKNLRRHGDAWMLRFLRLRPGRLVDIQKLFRLGLPKVNPSKL